MTRTKSDYYEVLGLLRTAGDEEIRRAFRARELHPDVSAEPEAEERFREVTAAYSVLSKPSARFLYDRFGYRGRGYGGFGPGGRRSEARILAEVEIDQIEADRGTKREVLLAAEEECEVCRGRGAVSGTDVRPCVTCGGNGRLRVSSGLGEGRLVRVVQCHDCDGLGQIFERRCPECVGLGRVTTRRVIKVRIPPGVEDGTRLRVMGEPEEDHLVVRVKPGPFDSPVVRWAATVLLACAVALLVYFVWFA
ncbi:MAG: DnaJ domain-containing protein [Actinomycetota bacterium]